jgi:hypothetical protein
MTRFTNGKDISAYTFQYREFRWNKGTRCVPYCLIAVHEEAGDKCAHEHLLADRFCLRYRGASLSTSSEVTRTLLRTKSWVSTWLTSSFRPTYELLLDVVGEDGGTTCSARNKTDWRDVLVVGWPRLAREEQEQWWCRARTDRRL